MDGLLVSYQRIMHRESALTLCLVPLQLCPRPLIHPDKILGASEPDTSMTSVLDAAESGEPRILQVPVSLLAIIEHHAERDVEAYG